MVSGTFTTDTNSDTYTMPGGGVLVGELQRTGGTSTVKLQTSLDEGSTWVDATDNAGADISFDMSSSVEHRRFAIEAHAGSLYRLNASSGSSPSVLYRLGRAVWQ